MPTLKEITAQLISSDRRNIYFASLEDHPHLYPGITNPDHFKKTSLRRLLHLLHQFPPPNPDPIVPS